MKDLFIQLSCAFSSNQFAHKAFVSEGQNRTNQYVNGFNNFFNFYSKYQQDYSNIYVVDNTLEDKSKVNPKILETIPNGVNYIFSNENTYGKNNKGSGCIEQWISCESVLHDYEYVWFSSSRSQYRDFSFYETFIKSPTNLFRKWHAGQFFTNSFFIESKTVLEYIKYRTPKSLSDNHICFEADLYNFLNDNSIKYKFLENIGINWNDEFAKQIREL